MPKLHDYFSLDLETFIDQNEFAEVQSIDGRYLTIILDNDRLKERSQKEYDGISVGEILFFVKKADYGSRPEEGTPVVFDGRQMYVFDAREDMGMYEIILKQNRGA